MAGDRLCGAGVIQDGAWPRFGVTSVRGAQPGGDKPSRWHPDRSRELVMLGAFGAPGAETPHGRAGLGGQEDVNTEA